MRSSFNLFDKNSNEVRHYIAYKLRIMQRCQSWIRARPPGARSLPTAFITAPRCSRHVQRRHLGFEAVTAVLIPPAVFTSLLVSLWTYKCFMMVIFQNKIIYMPSVPPFSRAEKVSDYASQCRPVVWKEHTIKSTDGVAVKLLEGSVPKSNNKVPRNNVVIVYFQGNASSLPPRLPFLSRTLTAIPASLDHTDLETDYTLVALSYRGFWTSGGRPSQKGIMLDAAATLEWALCHFDANTKVVLWGQSIGAGVASVALANLLRSADGSTKLKRVSALLLETPFVDLRTMLIALYPQKFLPYRYLAPFLWSTWDSKTALNEVGEVKPDLRVFMLQAGDDELVPSDNAPILEEACRKHGIRVERSVIAGALHTEVMMKSQGRSLIARFFRSLGDKSNRKEYS